MSRNVTHMSDLVQEFSTSTSGQDEDARVPGQLLHRRNITPWSVGQCVVARAAKCEQPSEKAREGERYKTRGYLDAQASG